MIEKETWSYTILGNSKGTQIYGTFFDIIINLLKPEELENLNGILSSTQALKKYIEKYIETLISYVFKTESRMGFQALGVFLMKYGANMTDKIKKLILKYSKWKDECKQLTDKKDREERKKYLLEFRGKVLKYNSNKIVYISDESVEDVIQRKKNNCDKYAIWRKAINHKILNLEQDLKDYFDLSTMLFKLNDFITLKLEGGKTFIYINNRKFVICKHIFVDLPRGLVRESNKQWSMDELIDRYDYQFLKHDESTYVPINTEFWVHCSNMQVWVENNYDSRLLHSNLSFPLLKELAKVGDPIANDVFKEEIAKRFSIGYIPVMNYLLEEEYIMHLNNDELEYLIDYVDDLINQTKNSNKKTELLKIKKKILKKRHKIELGKILYCS